MSDPETRRPIPWRSVALVGLLGALPWLFLLGIGLAGRAGLIDLSRQYDVPPPPIFQVTWPVFFLGILSLPLSLALAACLAVGRGDHPRMRGRDSAWIAIAGILLMLLLIGSLGPIARFFTDDLHVLHT